MLTLDNLSEFQFLRFDTIKLEYNIGSHLIANKCEVFASQLQKLARLNGVNSICVLANINQQRRDHFIDHTQFLEHLRNRLLPICGCCRRYKFLIGFESDKDSVANIITSILQMPQIIDCPNVAFRLVIDKQYEQLPIETISNWLHRNGNGNTDDGGNEFANQNHQERVLEIEVANISSSNIVEMIDHLKKVLFQTLCWNFSEDSLEFLRRFKAGIRCDIASIKGAYLENLYCRCKRM